MFDWLMVDDKARKLRERDEQLVLQEMQRLVSESGFSGLADHIYTQGYKTKTQAMPPWELLAHYVVLLAERVERLEQERK